MNYKLFVGIDISKLTIDVVFNFREQPENYQHRTFTNDYNGFDCLLAWLKEATGIGLQQTLFCCEHTGLYVLPISTYFAAKECNLWIENPLQIKRSIGLQRGKSDKADARIIARYAFSNQHQVRLYKAPSKTISVIKHLLAFREQLVRHQTSLKCTSTELKSFDKDNACFCIAESQYLLKIYQERIKNIDEQLLQEIEADEELMKQFKLVQSVHGIGKQTAFFILIQTHGFTAFTDYRKFACYCGLAPFPHTSGTSIRGRNRVSNLANKKLRALLTMCALNTIKKDNEFKRYYERKKAEGKSFLCILNVIKNKLVSRVFATIRRGTPYQSVLLAA
jgi:transposase